VEPELSPCVHLERHTSSTNNTPIVIQKKILNDPLPAFRRASVSRGLRRNSLLLYHQSDYKKSLGRIFGAATPPGALVKILPRIKNPVKDFC
jgi:hypothetical protein